MNHGTDLQPVPRETIHFPKNPIMIQETTETKPRIEPKLVRTLELDRQLRRIRFSPCGKFLFGTGHGGEIDRWDVTGDEPQELSPLKGHRGWAESLVFSSDQQTLFTVDTWGGLIAWRYTDPEPQPIWKNLEAHDGWIRSIALSDDGSLVATGGRDRLVRIWSAATGKLLHEFKGHEQEVYAVAIAPDGKTAVSGDWLGNLIRWDLSTGKQLCQARLESLHYYERDQDVSGLRSLMFLDGGESLLCAGSEPTKTGNVFGVPSLRTLDPETLAERKVWKLGVEKDGFLFDIARHPDGYFAFATSGTPGAGKFQLIDPEQEEPFFIDTKLSNPHSVAIHPDGKIIVVSATNRRSQGNGAVRDQEGNYLGNSSPLHFFELS